MSIPVGIALCGDDMHQEYEELFKVIQKSVDDSKLNTSLAKKLVETLNEEAHKNNIPIKFDPNILDVTVYTHHHSLDTERISYDDDEISLDDELSSYR
jgi:hypothetical protein